MKVAEAVSARVGIFAATVLASRLVIIRLRKPVARLSVSIQTVALVLEME